MAGGRIGFSSTVTTVPTGSFPAAPSSGLSRSGLQTLRQFAPEEDYSVRRVVGWQVINPVELTPATRSRVRSGSAQFREAIAGTHAEQQASLVQLVDWADALAAGRLVRLYSVEGKNGDPPRSAAGVSVVSLLDAIISGAARSYHLSPARIDAAIESVIAWHERELTEVEEADEMDRRRAAGAGGAL